MYTFFKHIIYRDTTVRVHIIQVLSEHKSRTIIISFLMWGGILLMIFAFRMRNYSIAPEYRVIRGSKNINNNKLCLHKKKKTLILFER